MNTWKIVLIVIIAILLIVGTALGSAIGFAVDSFNKEVIELNNNYSEIYTSEKYKEVVYVDNIRLITQDISCGYAVIEMLSSFLGNRITEEELLEEYGKVVTSSGKGFEKEMNKRFDKYTTKMHKNLDNLSLLKAVYDSLSKGMPVPFEWAAKDNNDKWTLHYSIVVGMDVKSDEIFILNPYGYKETLTFNSFLERTSYRAYKNMPFYTKLGFAFNIFETNTIFLISKK